MFEYKTQVKVDLNALRIELPALEEAYRKVGNRETTKGRSLFAAWNNTQKFFDRCMEQVVFADDKSSVILPVVGASKGNTARIYFNPSITSLPKVVRKAIVPINPDHVFAYSDIAAAEFALACHFAGETEALQAYHNGEDIYMYFANLFPEGTERPIIKRILLASVYNIRAYTVGKELGISETQAQRLLDKVSASLPRIQLMKSRLIKHDRLNQGYYSFNGFNKDELVRIAEINPKTGFSPDMACNAPIQSALGLEMQRLTNKLFPLIQGTLLTVFDSVFLEIKKESAPRLTQFLQENLYPLRIDPVTLGHSMWQAAYEPISA